MDKDKVRAVTEVCDKAVAWAKKTTWFSVSAEEKELRAAIKKLVELGWEENDA